MPAINSHRGSKAFGIMPDSRLWKPIKLGNAKLAHRVGTVKLKKQWHRLPAFARQTMFLLILLPNIMARERRRADYLSVRLPSLQKKLVRFTDAGGYPTAPGIYNEEQINAWKKVTETVHQKGGIIYCQLWALGRANGGSEDDVKVVSSGTTPFPGGKVPEQMTIEDIKRYLGHYKHAAKCAMEAGFDGVEVHGMDH
jgi:NADPH2 dehydrogenase